MAASVASSLAATPKANLKESTVRPFSVILRGATVVLGVVLLLGTSGDLTVDAGAASGGAHALLDAALHDATTSHWVHESVQVKQKGVVVQEANDDIGATEGL